MKILHLWILIVIMKKVGNYSNILLIIVILIIIVIIKIIIKLVSIISSIRVEFQNTIFLWLEIVIIKMIMVIKTLR